MPTRPQASSGALVGAAVLWAEAPWMAAVVALLPALGVCSMGRRCACLPSPGASCRAILGPPLLAPQNEAVGSVCHRSHWPLRILFPKAPGRLLVSRPVEAGLAAWRLGAGQPPQTSCCPQPRLQDRQGVQRGGGGSVVWGRWPRSGPGSASSPPSGKWSSRDPHPTMPGGAAGKQWAAPRGLEPPPFLKGTLAGRHDAS